MEKKDKLTIIVFAFLVISIITLVGINYYKNRPLKNIDRKIEYIMGYSYDSVLNKGEILFSGGIGSIMGVHAGAGSTCGVKLTAIIN